MPEGSKGKLGVPVGESVGGTGTAVGFRVGALVGSLVGANVGALAQGMDGNSASRMTGELQ